MKELTIPRNRETDILDYAWVDKGDEDYGCYDLAQPCQILAKIAPEKWLMVGKNRQHFYVSQLVGEKTMVKKESKQYKVCISNLGCDTIKGLVAHPDFWEGEF